MKNDFNYFDDSVRIYLQNRDNYTMKERATIRKALRKEINKKNNGNPKTLQVDKVSNPQFQICLN